MKILVVLFILIASTGKAQNIEIPRKEFTVSLSEEKVTLVRGENKKIDVRILKSKAYQKGKMKLGLSSSLPTGITLSFDPEAGNSDIVQGTVTALPEAAPGVYSVIVNATINYKTKGSILKIIVE